MPKLNCKNCKQKCCEGYLFNRITGDTKIILPKKIKYICTDGIQLVRVSRILWKCKFFKRKKCAIYKDRPFLCQYWFCRDHPKPHTKKNLAEYQANSILQLCVKTRGRK